MISNERLAEIRHVYADDHEVIGELLAEVEWLREERALAVAVTRLKDAIVLLVACCVTGVGVYTLCTSIFGLPWWVGAITCWAAGVPLAVWHDRRAASDAPADREA